MNKIAEKLNEFVDKWSQLDRNERSNVIETVISVLSEEQDLKPPKYKIITLGPPNVRGFYNVPEDTIYINAYILGLDTFETVLRSLAHLVRYKGQLADILKYLDVLENDNSNAENPRYEEVRKLKENYENYLYPWGNSQPQNEDQRELFWTSTDGKVDWNKIKSQI